MVHSRAGRASLGALLLTTFLYPRRDRADQWPGHRDCDNNLLSELSETEAVSLCHTRDISDSPLTLLTTCSTPSPISPHPSFSPDMDLIKVSPVAL